MRYITIALSIITGFALCIRYSLLQSDLTDLLGGIALLTLAPVGVWMLWDSLESR